jgi:DNA-binding IclR family transcriptional regulator
MTAMPSMYDGTDPGSETTIVPPSSMLERVTLILDLFDSPGCRLALEEVSRRTGLPRSSAHRILEHMTTLGWVSRSESGYGLGSRARWLGRLAGDASALRASAAPVLHELSVATGLVAHLAVLEGAEIVYLDKIGGPRAVDVPSRVGGRAPAHRTALGKAMLACLTPEQVEAQLAKHLGWEFCASEEIQMLHWDLDRARMRKGVAFERGECFPQIGCVAVGVRGSDGPIGAISLVAGADGPLERVAPMVVRAARRATQDLLHLRAAVGERETYHTRAALTMV